MTTVLALDTFDSANSFQMMLPWLRHLVKPRHQLEQRPLGCPPQRTPLHPKKLGQTRRLQQVCVLLCMCPARVNGGGKGSLILCNQ